MSARVFKPILLSEMPKMRTSPSFVDVKLASRGITKVRRALFNNSSHTTESDPEANIRFVEEELAKLAADQADRWNFDFLKGRPIIENHATSAAFVWIPVCASRSSSSSVLLPQRPLKHHVVIPQSPDISDLYPPPSVLLTTAPGQTEDAVIDDEKMVISTDGSSESSDTTQTPSKQLQSKITDFLAVRKRAEASSTSKKLPGCTPRPRKIPRLATS